MPKKKPKPFLKKGQRYKFGIVDPAFCTARGIFNGFEEVGQECFFNTTSTENLQPMMINARHVWGIGLINLNDVEDNFDDLEEVK